MFKLSSGFKAGLRALTILARNPMGTPVPISEMTPELNLSDKYLEQLLMALKRAGLVRSTRGANGGFTLARSATKITLLDIMTALQGPIAFCDCDVHACPDCIRPEIWGALELCIGATLSTITLQHLILTEPFQVMAHSVVLPDSPLWQDGAGI
ncbi:MAG: RrF2 family transcriptional regulator [Sulfobacillus sp.]